MALLSKTGSFTSPASTGTQTITGIGFTPKLVLILGPDTANVETAGAPFHYGAASGASNQWALSVNSADAVGTSNCARNVDTAKVVSAINPSGAVIAAANLTALASGEFTLNWTTTTSQVDLMYIALGGASLEVDVGTVTLPNTVTTTTKTGLSFQPKSIQVASTYVTGGSLLLSIGAATSSTSRFSNAIAEAGGVTTTDSDRLHTESYILSRTLSGAIDIRVDFDSFTADGFVLDVVTPPGAAQDLPYIAFGGSIDVGITSFTQKTTNGTQAVTGLSFQPEFTFLHSINTGGAFDSVISTAIINSGFSDATNSAAIKIGVENAITTANTTHTGSTSRAINMGAIGFVQGEATYASNDATGYTLNWTNVDGGARRIFGLSFADVGGGITGTGSTTTAGDTQSAAGVVTRKGTGATTAADITHTGTGTVTSIGVTGTGATTTAGDTQTATGFKTIAGVAVNVVGNVISVGTGFRTISGSSAVVAADVIHSGTGDETIFVSTQLLTQIEDEGVDLSTQLEQSTDLSTVVKYRQVQLSTQFSDSVDTTTLISDENINLGTGF